MLKLSLIIFFLWAFEAMSSSVIMIKVKLGEQKNDSNQKYLVGKFESLSVC